MLFFCPYELDEFMFQLSSVWLRLFTILGTHSLLSHPNSTDPDKTPRFAVSDQGMHYLSMSFSLRSKNK